MKIKQQSNKKATANTRSENRNKTKQKTKENKKLMNILRHSKNLLTVTECLQWTKSKRAGRILCQQNTVVNMPLISSVYFKGITNFN